MSPPEFYYCVTLRTLCVTFDDYGRSFELVSVDVTTVKGNLRNSDGIMAENVPYLVPVPIVISVILKNSQSSTAVPY